MTTDAYDVEALLRQAFSPVEPSERLSERVETTLQSLADAAAEELENWELAAMRDPRNWVRPVVATAVGTSAGTALILLRVRAAQKSRRPTRPDPAAQVREAIESIGTEVGRLLRR